MSVRDPWLDAQHIELLEMCRSMQFELERDEPQNWAFRQRLDEFVCLLREHDDAEVTALQQRGQNLPRKLCSQWASALQAIETLARSPQSEKLDPVKTQRTLCNWIQFHL